MKPIRWTGILVLVLCAAFWLPAYAAPAGEAGTISPGAEGAVPFAPEVQEARHARIALLTAIADARMEGTITYIGEISNGAGTGELNALRAKFADVSADLVRDTTRPEILEDRAALLRVRDEFRNETRKMMEEYDGNRTELREAVRATIEAHNATISALRADVDEKRDAAALAVFDRQTGRGEHRLTRLEGRGIDTTVPAETLAEIEGHRDPLAAALASDDRSAISEERGEIRGLAKEFRQEVRSLTKEQLKKPEN